ncbi:MAG: hypothetical protein QW265_04995, partial [Candidatus Bathyarchaeia archaeon]
MPSILNYVPQVLMISGICAFSPILSRLNRGLGKFLYYAGVFVGIASIAQSILMLLERFGDLFTTILLFLIGIMLFFRPIRNFRWAALLGLMFGIFATYLFRIFFPTLPTIAFLIFFGFVTITLYFIFKFLEDFFNLLVGMLSFPPIAIMLGSISFLQGILLMFNKSLAETFMR